jgi:hypothetical protein
LVTPLVAARPPVGEREFLELVHVQLRSRLPEQWRLEALPARERPTDTGIDALLRLVAPDGVSTLIVVEVRRSLVGRDVDRLCRRLREATDRLGSDAVPVVVSTFLSEPVRQALTDCGINYVDATGNLRLESRHPALFVRDVGAAKDPWRPPGRPRGSLRGEPAAQVIRALVDYRPPYSVPQLVRLSGSSNGATYRVVAFLEEQALLRRGPKGRITEVSWRALLELWSRDYSFYTSNQITGYLAPRGIGRVVDVLRAAPAVDETKETGEQPGRYPDRYVVTGSFAASAYALYAPTKLLTLYADNRDTLSRLLDLRAMEIGANVMIAQAAHPAVFQRRQRWRGIWVAAPSQTAVDLMTGPGRNPAEAQELLDWMQRNEPAWRTDIT